MVYRQRNSKLQPHYSHSIFTEYTASRLIVLQANLALGIVGHHLTMNRTPLLSQDMDVVVKYKSVVDNSNRDTNKDLLLVVYSLSTIVSLFSKEDKVI